MTVEPADSSLDVKEVRLSDILLNSNEPDFKMFFEFGCHEIDSIFTMVCYDWDPNQPVVRSGEEVFIADPVTQWPKSGVKQTLVDNLDTSFTFTYKFVYGSNLNADGATEDDDARRGVLAPVASMASTLPVCAQVPIVRGDPVSKKKKSDSGIDLGLAIGVLIAAVILAFCCGAACCVYRRRKDEPVAEVNGMEMGEVTVIESAPEATVKAVEVPPGPPPDVQGTPNPVRAEGEMI